MFTMHCSIKGRTEKLCETVKYTRKDVGKWLDDLRAERSDPKATLRQKLSREIRILEWEKAYAACVEDPRVSEIMSAMRAVASRPFNETALYDDLCKLMERHLEEIETLMKERGHAFVFDLLAEAPHREMTMQEEFGEDDHNSKE